MSQEKRIFNYRLSRARRISENGFGILAARWRIFRKPIEALPGNVDKLVKASVALHNYLMSTDSTASPSVRYVPPRFVDFVGEDGKVQPGLWREITKSDDGLRHIGRLGANRGSKEAERFRDNFTTYFQTSQGSVPWQTAVVDRTMPHTTNCDA